MKIEVWKRRLLIRLALVVVWIGIGALLFVFNRGHTLLIDNHNVENPSLRAPDLITVSVNQLKPMEFFRNDRDIFKVSGMRHWIKIEFSDGTPPFEKEFRLPLGPDMYLLSVPKMINGIEPYFEVFHTQQESRSDDSQSTSTSTGDSATTEETSAAP